MVCTVCNKVYSSPSLGGPGICGSCDAGVPPYTLNNQGVTPEHLRNFGNLPQVSHSNIEAEGVVPMMPEPIEGMRVPPMQLPAHLKSVNLVCACGRLGGHTAPRAAHDRAPDITPEQPKPISRRQENGLTSQIVEDKTLTAWWVNTNGTGTDACSTCRPPVICSWHQARLEELATYISQKIVSELEAVVIKGGCGCLTCDALKDRIAALRPNIPREDSRDA